MVLALIGIGALVAGLVSAFLLFADIDGGAGFPEWAHSVFTFLAIVGIIPGMIVTLIGLGILIGSS